MMVSTAHAALTITSNGADMSDSLLAAIRTHDTVILDGTKGEIILDHTVVLKHLEHKTIIGTHDACLRSRFRVTKDIRAMLDSAHVMDLSTAGDGGLLSNGMMVREQRERETRQLLIDRFNDPDETFRSSGGIQLSHCRHITIRGLRIQGPGAIDVSGNDLLGMDHSMYILIDSCVLMDGMDGNMDITSQSDSITISHCYFGYSELRSERPIGWRRIAANCMSPMRIVLGERVVNNECRWCVSVLFSWIIADGNVLRLIRRLMSAAKPPSLLTLPSSVRVSGLLTAPPPTPNVLYDSIIFIRAFKFHLVIRKMRKKLAYM